MTTTKITFKDLHSWYPSHYLISFNLCLLLFAHPRKCRIPVCHANENVYRRIQTFTAQSTKVFLCIWRQEPFKKKRFMIFVYANPALHISPRILVPCCVHFLATSLYLSTQIFNLHWILSSRGAELQNATAWLTFHLTLAYH